MEEDKKVSTITDEDYKEIMARALAIAKGPIKKELSDDFIARKQMEIADYVYQLNSQGKRITPKIIAERLGLDVKLVNEILSSKSFEEITQYMGMDDFSIAAVLSNHIYNTDANTSIKAIQERNKMVGAYKNNLNINLDIPEEIRMMKDILNPNIIEGDYDEVEEDNKE